MKKYLFIVLLLLTSVVFCMDAKYSIYYLPLDAQFYTAPTKEYIVEYGKHINLNSKNIESIFAIVKSDEETIIDSTQYSRLRILIIETDSKKEMFITDQRNVVFNGKIFQIEDELINSCITEIEDALKE